MKTVTFDTTADNAFGKKLTVAVPFTVTYTEYETHAEMIQAKDGMTEEEELKERNTQRKQKALASARASALEVAGIKKPTLDNDTQLQLMTIYKVYIAKGKSHEEARNLASAAIGEEWSD
jgi:hypothetical protein